MTDERSSASQCNDITPMISKRRIILLLFVTRPEEKLNAEISDCLASDILRRAKYGT